MKKIRRIISIILLGVDPYLEIRTTLEYNNQNIKYFSKSFNVEDDNGFAMVAFFNPETEKMENKNFDLGNIHWFDDEEGLQTWGKMKIFDFLKNKFPNYYN